MDDPLRVELTQLKSQVKRLQLAPPAIIGFAAAVGAMAAYQQKTPQDVTVHSLTVVSPAGAPVATLSAAREDGVPLLQIGLNGGPWPITMAANKADGAEIMIGGSAEYRAHSLKFSGANGLAVLAPDGLTLGNTSRHQRRTAKAVRNARAPPTRSCLQRDGKCRTLPVNKEGATMTFPLLRPIEKKCWWRGMTPTTASIPG